MFAPKLQDMQEFTVTVVHGNVSKQTKVTHNLKDNSGQNLTPETIIAEVISHAAGGGASTFACITPIVRSNPEDGTFLFTVQLDQDPAGGATATVKVRCTSIIWMNALSRFF